GTFGAVYQAVDVRTKKGADEENPSYVAVKRIFATSSPERIHGELEVLYALRSSPNIASIIEAIRHEEQVVAVLEYFKHEDFRNYYRSMSIDDVKDYMRALFTALEKVHAYGYLHRDVKPTNFLYDPKRATGVLVDFGLAEVWPNLRLKENGGDSAFIRTHFFFFFVIESPKAQKANRAGTRGLRAPEVLLKVVHQTSAIDMWSAGVVLLSIWSGSFPFFKSDDDIEALLEIAVIFGKKPIAELAKQCGRSFETNIPNIGAPKDLLSIIKKMNPRTAAEIPKAGMDLLRSLLTLDPDLRITAHEALNHRFLSS
ncbi:kinase-like domain-containing protein, partial [Blyttiomyces helicus]